MSRRIRLILLATAAGICAPAHAQSDMIGRQIERNVSNAVSNQTAQRIIRPTLTVKNAVRATRLAASANGRFAAAAFDNGLVTIWDLERGREVVRFANERGSLLAVSNDGRFLVLAERGTLYRRDQAGRSRLADASASAAALTPDDARLIVSLASGGLEVRDAAKGSVMATEAAAPTALAVASAADGSTLLIRASDGALARWDQRSRSMTELWKLGRPVSAAAISPTGGVAVVSAGRSTTLINLASMKPLALQRLASPVALALPAGGKAVLSALQDGSLIAADTQSGETLAKLATTQSGWAVLDYSGRFDGNTTGIEAVSWQSDVKTLELGDLARKYFEPGMLSNVVSGRLASLSRVPANVSVGVAMPPKVEIKLSGEGGYQAGKPFQVAVIVEDLGGGMDDIRLFHNGKLVDRGTLLQTQDFADGGRKFRALVFSLLPSSGLNTFRATAKSNESIESQSERVAQTFSGSRQAGKLLLVSIGVNAYAEPIPQLSLAVKDAETLRNELGSDSGLFSGVAQTALFDARATRETILANLARVGQQSMPEDTIVLFLAGHGISVSADEWLFLPFGADGSNAAKLRRTSVSAQELQQALISAKARRIVLAIDACQSGAAFGAFAEQRTAFLRLLSNISRDTGIVIYAATQEGSDSYEIQQLGHGIFTYSLLQGLEGKAAARGGPEITAFGLADYVENTVPALSQFYKNKRQDTATFRLGVDFPLATAARSPAR